MMEKSILVLLLGLLSIANTINFSFSSNSYSYSDVLCIQTERQALLSFKQSLKDPSNLLSTWSSAQDCCKTWKGVRCHNTTHHVVGLHLMRYDLLGRSISLQGKSYNELQRLKLGGEISPSLLELKHLNYLDLSFNDFGGIRIPSFLGSIQNLIYLNLSEANFGGTVPHQLGNLSSLRKLDLGYNFELDAENLEWLSHLSSLRYLNMSDVNLTKASDHWLQVINMLPSLSELHLSFCNLINGIPSLPYVNFTSLAVLDLSRNNFGPLIPNWLFSFSGLASLDIGSNGFQGPLPEALQNLTNLKSLGLFSNNFKSTDIPNWLYNFSSLVFLDLSNNDLQGTISDAIGNLTSIKELYLSRCNFEGEIPRTIEHLRNLRTLSLRRNKLNGKLSGFFPSNLEDLDLADNKLSGPLPDQLFGLFKNLQSLSLSNNSFSGPIPESIGCLSKLISLSLPTNSFEGVVSEIHFSNLTRLLDLEMDSTSLVLNVSSDWIPPFQITSLALPSVKLATHQFPAWLRTQKDLQYLDLSNSGISDIIPTWFWNLSFQISYLNLSHNHIKGELPKFLKFNHYVFVYLQSNSFEGPLPRLSPNIFELDLSNNSLSGPISNFLCNLWNNSNQLRFLDLSENLLSGEIPDCWMYWNFLSFINLGTNNLRGNVPSSMGSLLQLQSLHLSNNNLSGELPLFLQNCTHLRIIDLSKNGFSGVIPGWMGKILPNLSVLSLRSNKFSGGIPLQLCYFISLQIVDLGHNNLSGTIPRCLSNLSAIATKQNSSVPISYRGYFLYVEKALLMMKGMLLEYSNTLRLVVVMDLSSNSLSGEIPKELTNLLGLISLNLSENCLRGKIPEKIGIMDSLESLDFSVNKLSGVIPQSMAKLHFLGHLNLSYNNLSGKIPTSTQLQSFSKLSYVGNQGLYGPPLTEYYKQGEAPQDFNDGDGVQEGKDDIGIEMESFYLSMLLGVVVGFWGVFGILVFKKTWRVAYFQVIEDLKDKVCTLF